MKMLTFVGEQVPLRDGEFLCADVYLPPNRCGEKFPVVLNHSPYNATGARNGGALSWIERGYVFVSADCRGRGNSSGKFIPWKNDVNDAWDLLTWITAQSWSDGRVSMIGGSYPAVTQFAALRSGHPALDKIAPSAMTLDPYEGYFTNQAPEVSFQKGWHNGFSAVSWDEVAAHPDRNDEYWKRAGDLRDIEKSKAAIFYQASWFDILGEAAFETFAYLRKLNPRSCMRVGPWGHGVNTKEGEPYLFGAESLVTEKEEIDFLTSDWQPPKKIQIFVMGKNVWRYEDEWPLARTKYTELPLAGGEFSHDPENPVPTCGGRIVGKGGQRDQSAVEARADVLTETFPVFEEDFEITGNIDAHLVVESTAECADFTVKLVDVFPDGTPLNICDGIWREKVGGRTEIDFHVDVTSYCFLKGHALRVELAGSNAPRFEPNPLPCKSKVLAGSHLILPVI